MEGPLSKSYGMYRLQVDCFLFHNCYSGKRNLDELPGNYSPKHPRLLLSYTVASGPESFLPKRFQGYHAAVAF